MNRQRLAIIDLDGTLLHATTAERVFFLYTVRTGKISLFRAMRFLFSFYRDVISSGLRKTISFNATFLRGEKPEVVKNWAREFGRVFLDHAVPAKLKEKIISLKKQGCMVVLLSGSLQILVEELKDVIDADYLIGGKLEVQDGLLTGQKKGVHPYGRGKVTALFDEIHPETVDWQNSWALADRYSDLPVFELVGNPVAVNPDRRLRRLARQRGWEIIG